MIIEITKEGKILGNYDGFIKSHPPGVYDLDLKPYIKKRTVAQNKLYRRWLDIVAKDTGNTTDWLHEHMKKNFLSKRKLGKLGGKRSYQNIPRSTTELNVQEFTKFLEQVHLFFSELGFILPTMDESELNSLYQYGLNEK